MDGLLPLLSRVHSVGVRTKEPQRRDERGEKSQVQGAHTNHFSVMDLHVTGTGLPL